MARRFSHALFGILSFVLFACSSGSNVPPGSEDGSTPLYVSTSGSDSDGDGSEENPWATIENAIKKLPKSGGYTVNVQPGLYDGPIEIKKGFENPVTLRSKEPYQAMLTNVSDNFTPILLIDYEGSMNLTIDGFVFSNENTTQGGCENRYGMMIHFSNVLDITFQNNIVYGNNRMPRCNEMFKINIVGTSLFPTGIKITGNVFGSPPAVDGDPPGTWGSNLLDIFEPGEVDITDNIFFSDRGDTGGDAFVNLFGMWGTADRSPRYQVSRNIFLKYEGNSASAYVNFGGEGEALHDIVDALVENNLIIGESSDTMAAPFVFRGVKNVTVRANTITGTLPSEAYGLKIGSDGDNPASEDIFVRNNIWSDATGTMSPWIETYGGVNLGSILLDHNLFWNGGSALPSGGDIAPTEDSTRVVGDPKLESTHSDMVLPAWNSENHTFISGSETIREEFERLVMTYGAIASDSPAINAADSENMPEVDILGYKRDSQPDIGAFEFGASE